jgi:hypothetical protein
VKKPPSLPRVSRLPFRSHFEKAALGGLLGELLDRKVPPDDIVAAVREFVEYLYANRPQGGA